MIWMFCAGHIQQVNGYIYTYYSMEFASLIPLWSAQGILRLPRTKLAKIFSRSGDDIGKEFHLDAAEWLA
jgi:hypothetical protein